MVESSFFLRRLSRVLPLVLFLLLPASAGAQGLPSLGLPVLPSLSDIFGRTWNLTVPDSLDLELRISALFLGRSSNKNLILVTDSFFPGGSTLLTANDLDLKHRTFTDLSVRGRYRMFGVEYRRLDGPMWKSSTPTVNSPGGAVLQFLTPVGNTFFPANLSASYGSDLSSWEVNARWFITDSVALFVGYRKISLPEAALIADDIGPGLNLVSVSIPTDNPMSGWQLGVDGTLVVVEDWFRLDAHARVGRLTNTPTAGTSITQSVVPGVSFAANATDENRFEFVEAGIEGTFRLIRGIEVTLGYQKLRLNAVALGPSQIPAANLVAGIFAFIPQDQVVFEGLKCGVRVLW